MQNSVSASFLINQIIDGDVVLGGLLSTKSLSQFYNQGDNNVVPNWATAANQPVIYPYLYLGSDGTPLVPTGVKWYYNTHDVSGLIPVDTPKFDLTEYQITTGVSVPALKIIGNLASRTTNADNDVFFFDGTVVAGGHEISVSLRIDVRISQSTSSGFYARIASLSGTTEVSPVLTDSLSSLTLSAKLFSADDTEQSTGYSRKWYKNGTDINVTTQSITVSRDNSNANLRIDTTATYRCDFIDAGNTVVASAYIEVQDATDPYAIKITWTNNKTSLAQNETAQGTCSVVKRSAPSTPVSGFSFEAVLTKANGSVITQSSGCQCTPAGAIAISYDALSANGGSISGYVTATKN